MLSTLHFTHNSRETMLKQAQCKIFWPCMRDDPILCYLLTIPCGMTTSIKGENNKVRNNQKVGILLLSIELVNNSNQCSTWQLIEFEVFEWIVLIFLIRALIYWGLKKIFRKDWLLYMMKKRREQTKSRKLQKKP